MAWTCGYCTFAHTLAEELFLTCAMCEHPRYDSKAVSGSNCCSSSLDSVPTTSTESPSLRNSDLVGSPCSSHQGRSSPDLQAPLKAAADFPIDDTSTSITLPQSVTRGASANLGHKCDDEEPVESAHASNQDPLHAVRSSEPTLSESDEVQDLDIGQALLSHADCAAALDAAAERTVSTATEDHGWAKIDNSNWVRMGSDNKTAAGNEQWGRAKPSLLAQMVKLTGLSPRDSFVDVGSGCGQVVFWVALAVGCPSAGVEIVQGRHSAALQIRDILYDHLITNLSLPTHQVAPALGLRPVGRVELLNGSFTEGEGIKMLLDASVLFVNNAEGIFSPIRGGLDLDEKLAQIMCRCKVGTRVLALDVLSALQDMTDVLGEVQTSSETSTSSVVSLKSSISRKLSSCIDDAPSVQQYDPSIHKRAFTLTKAFSEPGACSWSEQSQSRQALYLYEKVSDEWVCSGCGLGNSLLDEKGDIRSICKAHAEKWLLDEKKNFFCPKGHGRIVRHKTRTATLKTGSSAPPTMERLANGRKASSHEESIESRGGKRIRK